MVTALAVPAVSMGGRYSDGDDHLDDDRDLLDRGPAQEAIGQMARLLRDTRGSMLLGGSVLSAVTIGMALEAAFSPSVLRPDAAGLVRLVLLAGLLACWLRAGALLLLAGRPVLGQLNDQRWRIGAPVDPRVRWAGRPTAEDGEQQWTWTHVKLMLGAARIRSERVHLADTWTFITAGCFLVWTVLAFFG